MRLEALVALKAFVECHRNKPDEYEVWGGAERPEHPVTMGHLRGIVRADAE